MSTSFPRRRILCLRPRLNPSAGAMLQATADEWVEALSLHADVISIDGDCDLQQVCDRSRPDMIVVDALHWGRPFAPDVVNPRHHPEIPRALFFNSDPHDPLRPLTMRMAEMLGVEAFFVSGETYRHHMPELRHQACFFTPQFVDDSIYRDYQLPKTIPVSIFGGHLAPGFYPWRARLIGEIQHVFPTLVYPHPGYEKGREDPFAVSGDAYARILNQSYFSAADTTRLDYGVRKHLEIPASGSVLFAPESSALASYGFVDMENCLLGSGVDLFRKIDGVSRVPEQYRRICEAGKALVHERYTRRNWRLMLDWLECRLHLKPGQVVQQVGRYGPFRGMMPTASTVSVMAAPQQDSDMTAALRATRAAILSGDDLRTVETRIVEASTWIGHVAEPYFLIGMLCLLKGDPVTAAVTIGRRAEGQGSIDLSLATLDPVETAWLLLIARLIDNAELENAMRDQAAGASHVSLRRVLWLLDHRGNDIGSDSDLVSRRPGDQLSVHWLGDEDFTVWSDLVRRVFLANLSCPGAFAIGNRVLADAA